MRCFQSVLRTAGCALFQTNTQMLSGPRLYHKPFEGTKPPARVGFRHEGGKQKMSESTVSELEFAAFVAIDWADRKHVWALRDTELLLEILVNHRGRLRARVTDTL